MAGTNPIDVVNRFCDEVINARGPDAAEGIVADDFVEFDPRTHQAAFMGFPPGKTVKVNGVVIDRVIDGLMVGSRMLMNALSMLQELGVLPA
jgi:hypothetical protein